MYILGVSYGYTATAVLLKDGKIISCASEERFNGIKNFNGFPKQAIDYCLKSAGISGRDLDLVATPYLHLPPSNLSDSLKLDEKHDRPLDLIGKPRKLFRTLRYHFPIIRPLGVLGYRLAAIILGSGYTKKQQYHLAQYLGVSSSKIKSFNHHLCHAAAAYYSSPYHNQKALVLTLDGEGDELSGTVNIFSGKSFKVIAKIPREYSLGYIYGHLTKYLGMKPHEHEYKVMGLAPYAKDIDVNKLYEKISPLVGFTPNNPLMFTMPFNSQDFDQYLHNRLSNSRFDHLAGAFQKLMEEKISQWVSHAIKETGIHTIILSGGVFMNIKVNQVISNLKEVKKFYVLPSCADESAPIGSCYLGHLRLSSEPIQPVSVLYWGPQYSDSEIIKVLKKNYRHIQYKKIRRIEHVIAKLLSRGKIVARLSGRMEFGARALGNRSIMAHPQDPAVIKIINDKIKNRDFWMPFAPTILRERMADYVINPKNIPAPYMILGFNSTLLAQKHLLATLHPSDLTMRPQIIEANQNPGYYRIIKEFEKLTGIGGILNTSFNLHGIPIVLGPSEAVLAFLDSGLEYLAMENYLVTKK